jgi:tetratricopeptide (TPR) repeat protein
MAHGAARRRALLLAAAFAPFGATGAFESAADANLKKILERARTPPSSALAPEQLAARLQERTELLARGEAALARNEVEPALRAFEQAAGIQHAADTEMGLVRTYMQGGEYRRALAFVAHTANAHREAPGGAALYAWLLYVGGQKDAALRMLVEAQSRFGDDTLLASTLAQLRSEQPLAAGTLLATPARLAPFDAPVVLPASARTVASATLIDRGTRAIAPLAAVTSADTVWLRNGVGMVSRARIEARIDALGVCTLRLDTPPPAVELVHAPRDPFPGSIGYVVEYVASADATPRWPLLRAGFFGAVAPDGGSRALGIESPRGPRGGPVFDAAGRWAGIALASTNGPDRLLPRSQLIPHLHPMNGGDATAAGNDKMPADQVYERALHTAAQLLTVR